jgi:hypothetical protein
MTYLFPSARAIHCLINDFYFSKNQTAGILKLSFKYLFVYKTDIAALDDIKVSKLKGLMLSR